MRQEQYLEWAPKKRAHHHSCSAVISIRLVPLIMVSAGKLLAEKPLWWADVYALPLWGELQIRMRILTWFTWPPVHMQAAVKKQCIDMKHTWMVISNLWAVHSLLKLHDFYENIKNDREQGWLEHESAHLSTTVSNALNFSVNVELPTCFSVSFHSVLNYLYH